MEADKPIRYTGIVDVETFVKAQRLHAGRWYLLWPCLVPFLLTYLSWSRSEDVSLAVLCVPFAIGCLFPELYRRSLERSWRKIHQQSPQLNDPVRCTISNSGIEFDSSAASGYIDWSRFIRVKQSPDLLLLYEAPNVFQVIPRELFASVEEWQRAKDAVNAHVERGA